MRRARKPNKSTTFSAHNAVASRLRYSAANRERCVIVLARAGRKIGREAFHSAREASMAKLTINGRGYDLDVDPQTPLLWAIREQAGLTGTKYGCGIAQCGACTVHMNGDPVRSCSVFVEDAVGKEITTIEGLAQGGTLTKVQEAWVAHDVPQCGYCQAGMIMAVSALLKAKPKPTDADIDEAITNICRCGTFQQVREAIHAAAKA